MKVGRKLSFINKTEAKEIKCCLFLTFPDHYIAKWVCFKFYREFLFISISDIYFWAKNHFWCEKNERQIEFAVRKSKIITFKLVSICYIFLYNCILNFRHLNITLWHQKNFIIAKKFKIKNKSFSLICSSLKKLFAAKKKKVLYKTEKN